MGGSKRIFISDIHLGPPDNPSNWYKKEKHEQNLLAALQDVRDRSDEIKDLVFLGDLVDTWVCPVDEQPVEPGAVLEHHSNIVEGIRACLGEVENVFYLNGNHDMHVTQEVLDEFFDTGDGDTVEKINQYNAGPLYAEHGHRFAMFNARDKRHDTLDGLPVGYFICRMLSSTDKEYDSPSAFLSYVDDILEAAFTSSELVQSVVEAQMELAGLEPDDEFKMPDGRRDITVADVAEKYEPLYDRWVQKHGHWFALHSVRAELGSLGWFADRLSKRHDYKVVVLGHTHDSQLDEDLVVFDEDRIYANSGYWCTDEPTMVEVDKRPDGQQDVRLWKFRDGEPLDDPFRSETV